MKDWREQVISRILFKKNCLLLVFNSSLVVIYLGWLLPTTSSGSPKRDWKKTNHNLFDLAPNRGLPSQHLSMLLVRSYRTFAPLPVYFVKDTGGIFLWHYPRSHLHWELPSKSGLWGVRTFLKKTTEAINLQPPRLLSPLISVLDKRI